MPTYRYRYTDRKGGEFETEHSIKATALATHEGRPVERLIAGAPRFSLVSGDSGGWASTGYSKTEPQRQAEAALGRKLHKPL